MLEQPPGDRRRATLVRAPLAGVVGAGQQLPRQLVTAPGDRLARAIGMIEQRVATAHQVVHRRAATARAGEALRAARRRPTAGQAHRCEARQPVRERQPDVRRPARPARQVQPGAVGRAALDHLIDAGGQPRCGARPSPEAAGAALVGRAARREHPEPPALGRAIPGRAPPRRRAVVAAHPAIDQRRPERRDLARRALVTVQDDHQRQPLLARGLDQQAAGAGKIPRDVERPPERERGAESSRRDHPAITTRTC